MYDNKEYTPMEWYHGYRQRKNVWSLVEHLFYKKITHRLHKITHRATGKSRVAVITINSFYARVSQEQ